METQQATTGSVSMTSEAYDLLDCFEEEIGGVVRALAAFHTQKRAIEEENDNPVIGVEEMRRAVNMFRNMLKKAQEEGSIPKEKFDEFEGMLDCFKQSSNG